MGGAGIAAASSEEALLGQKRKNSDVHALGKRRRKPLSGPAWNDGGSVWQVVRTPAYLKAFAFQIRVRQVTHIKVSVRKVSLKRVIYFLSHI